MGGFMPYGRVRHRNGLEWRGENPEQLYPGPDVRDFRGLRVREGLHGLIGDLNRMERDYLDPPAELTRRCGDPDPATQCSMATGVDVETVRAVLAFVFRESR